MGNENKYVLLSSFEIYATDNTIQRVMNCNNFILNSLRISINSAII